MNTTGDTTKLIVPSFVMQEEGSYKVFVHLSIPKLKLKRSFLNFFKFVPSNGHVKVLDFQNQSFTFTIHVQTKLYSISIARLPGEIQPERCSIKYQRDGCRITLIKLDPTRWMNRICDDPSPGLDIQEDDDQSPSAAAPSQSSQPITKKGPAPSSPFNVVCLAPPSLAQPTRKKGPAPPPPSSVVPLSPSQSSQPTRIKGPAPPPPFNVVCPDPSPLAQPIRKKGPAPPPPSSVVPLGPSQSSQPTRIKGPAPPPPFNVVCPDPSSLSQPTRTKGPAPPQSNNKRVCSIDY